MTFQLKAKNVFLTYPQCSITKEAMLYYLMEQHSPDGIRVGEELHEDGSPHLHVFMCKDPPFRTRKQSFFDVYGFHPNTQDCRSHANVLKYVAKDGNFIDGGILPGSSSKRTWADVMSASSKEEALELIATEFPRDYILNLEKVEYFLNKRYEVAIEAYVHDSNLTFKSPLPQKMADWLLQYKQVPANPFLCLTRNTLTTLANHLIFPNPRVTDLNPLYLSVVLDWVKQSGPDHLIDIYTGMECSCWICGINKQLTQSLTILKTGKDFITINNFSAHRLSSWPSTSTEKKET
jgi:hypothetical protein